MINNKFKTTKLSDEGEIVVVNALHTGNMTKYTLDEVTFILTDASYLLDVLIRNKFTDKCKEVRFNQDVEMNIRHKILDKLVQVNSYIESNENFYYEEI